MRVCLYVCVYVCLWLGLADSCYCKNSVPLNRGSIKQMRVNKEIMNIHMYAK